MKFGVQKSDAAFMYNRKYTPAYTCNNTGVCMDWSDRRYV